MIPNALKTIPAVFGTIGVSVAETGNPVIYGLFNKSDVPVDVVRFQDGAPPANGFCVEDLIAIVVDRLEHLDSELPSDYNKVAIEHLQAANKALEARMKAQRNNTNP